MKRLLFSFLLVMASLWAWADNTVTVSYNGNTATVTVDDNVAQYLTVTQSGAHVSIAQSSAVTEEITYTLTGTSTNGEFYMSGSYKATIELNGLTLTNTTPVYSGAAIHIQNGKRINVKVITGTTNTLTDAANGSQKGCLYVKGHAEFKQQGTLNIVGNTNHGIKAGEYISVKNATINITSAVGDGISCNQYFLMESGMVSISGTGDDGIQCDLDGETSTGMTVNHEDEDSGNMYVSGGNITINSDAIAAKGIKCQGDAYISGNAVINVTTTGKGEWDEEEQETNAACGLSSDGDINISGGTLVLTATGSGGKGMKCDNVLNISGGDITVSTTGGLYYNDGNGHENTNYTSSTDWVDNKYYSAAKGIKAGYKEESGNTTICYGGINISGGTIYVTTKGRNAEGIESKNYLNVTGGETTIDAYDDGINAAQDLYITDGYLYSRSSNNDGIDANGNVVIEDGLIYAVGAASPEVAIDANSEENKKFHFNGGILIAIGGLESGSTLAQTCYQTSSVSSNTWYSMTYGGNVIAFLTPTVSSGSGGGPGGGGPGGGGPGGGGSSGMVISAPSTPTLKSGVTVSNGTPVFYGPKCYLDATVTGGSNVSLSQYSSGGGGSSGSYTVTATANPTAGGTVTGAGVYPAHTLCTLTATANAGYTFVNWTRNGSVASTDPIYSFYVTENTTCVANFTQQTTSYTITATANPTNGGTITGAGTYSQGTTVTMTATANEGYNFINWTENGTVVSTEPTYTFVITANRNLVADFEEVIPVDGPFITLDSYTPNTALVGENTDLSLTFKNVGNQATIGTTNVSLTSNDSNVTIIYGTGSFDALAADATTTVSGFSFSLDSGVTLGSDVSLHYTAVNGSDTWEGDFTITPNQIFTVTVAANNADYGTVSGGGQYNYGESCTVSATPADGYMFSNWTNNGNMVSANTEYTFIVASDMELVANFAEGIMIGDGTDTYEYLPSYSYYKYALTEQIYTPTELGGAGLITSIAFYNDGAEKTRTYDFYMKATTKNTFTSKTDWIAVSADDKVFSGSVTMVAGDWTTITFTTPFAYDGTSNVVLVADDNSGAYTSAPHMACRVFDASSQALYYWGDNTDFNPLSPPTSAGSSSWGGTPNDVLSVKNQLMITKSGFDGCVNATPSNVEVINITANSATVTWTGYSESYNVCLGIPNIATLVDEDFAETIPTGWDNNSNYPWTIVDGHIQSGNAGVANSTSSISVTVTFAGDGTVEFDAECMGEGTSTIWDKCIFSIDGVAQFTYGANVSGWNHYSFEVAAGEHTFTWTYSKDSSVNPTGDYFAVDNVVMISGEIEWSVPVAVEDAEYTFTGLSPETEYCARVQGVCDGTESAWSEMVLFTTTELTTVTQTVALSAGWNWFSTNVEITLDDLKAALVAALSGTAITIKSQNDGSTTYNGIRWRGSLDTLDVTQMYKIEAATDSEVVLEGMPLNPVEHPVTIVSGANWIGFPLSTSMTLTEAFAGFAVDGDMVKAQSGSSTYTNGRWRGTTLTTLEPGKGYIYKSAAMGDRTFTFPIGEK